MAGGGARAHYATLHYDGKAYPSNPSDLPATRKGTVLRGIGYISETISPETGLKFKVP